ncbi:hypothetical protein HELRODRAFT_167785 [Helobdella robusta]|uniref:Uncharacterized protein n=1 Tax=Helobdella robusta TaxID=6412 RepID=T1EZT0_HELRO|nr:hypothetical protein HELRODRAFT_167785 [Helobdella robusta]ESO09955.1 hypothetical protein HELRODRAFT_167785 [Helobdella robusta]
MAGKRTLEGEESNEFTWKKLKGNANPGIYPVRERFDEQYDNFMVQRRNANYMNINMAAADAEYLRHPVNYALNKQFHLMSDSMSSNNGSNGFMYPFDRPNFSENNAPNGMDVKSYPNFFAMQRPQFNPQHQYLNFHNSQAEQPINRLPMEFLNNHANMYRQHMPFRTELIKPDSVPMFMNLVNSNNSVNVSQEMISPYQKVNGYRSPNCKPFTNPFLHFKPTFNEPYPRPMNGFTNEFDSFSTNFSAMSKSNPDYQNFNRSFIDSSVAENKTSNSNCDIIQPSELEKKVNKNIKQCKKDKHIENSPACDNGWLVSSSYTVASSHSALSLVSSPILKPSSMLNSMPTSALSSKSHWNPGLPARNEKLVNELDLKDKSAMKNNCEVNENHSGSKHLKTNFKNDVELNEKHHLMQHQSLKSPELHDNKFEEYIQPDHHSSMLFQQQAYFSRNQELPQDIVAKQSMPAFSSDFQPHLQPTALKQHMQQSLFEKQKHLLHMPSEQHLQQPSFSQHSQQLLQHPTKQVTSKQPVQQTSPQNHSQKVFNQYSNCSPQNHCETLSHQLKNHQNLQHKQHHHNQQQHSVNSNNVDRQLSPKENLQQRIHQPYLPEQCSTKLNQSLHHEAQRPCNTPSQIDQATLTHPQRTATVNHHLSPKLHHHKHPPELVSSGRSNNSLMHKNAPQPVMGHHHDPSQHLPRAPQQFQPPQHFSPRYKSVQQLNNPHFQPHHSLLQYQEQHRNTSEIHLRSPQRQQHFSQSVPYQHNLTQGVQRVHFPDDNTRDPMRMIEKLSNRHFNTYESQFIFGNDKINLHGCSEHENNFTSNRASALQHNSFGTHAMSRMKNIQLQFWPLKKSDSNSGPPKKSDSYLLKILTPTLTLEPKRNKKDSEREQYEMWLNERKKLLIERINELERVKEQGMNESQNQRAVYNKSNSSQEPNNQQVEHQQRFTADDFNEDIKHLNSAIEQMKKDLHEHEMIMKMFFTSNVGEFV